MEVHMAEQSKKRPIHEIRIGSVKAAIWRNEGPTGAWHSVIFERIYKDGDEWKSTANFGREDLLVLAKVADQAHTWAVEQEARGELR
jgi:hypothetical protein